MRPARPRFTAAGPGVRVSVDHPGAREGTQVDTSNALFLTFLSLSTARCDLPGRDLRLLDPVFVYPSTILGRERAMVVNLESIRCIITADEVLLLNVTDPAVQQSIRCIITADEVLLLNVTDPAVQQV
ncbi:unnamed protein product [Closterium sp. NIES-54]